MDLGLDAETDSTSVANSDKDVEGIDEKVENLFEENTEDLVSKGGNSTEVDNADGADNEDEDNFLPELDIQVCNLTQSVGNCR